MNCILSMVKWPNVPKVIKEQTGLAMVIVANYQKRKIKLREIPHFQLRKNKRSLNEADLL